MKESKIRDKMDKHHWLFFLTAMFFFFMLFFVSYILRNGVEYKTYAYIQELKRECEKELPRNVHCIVEFKTKQVNEDATF